MTNRIKSFIQNLTAKFTSALNRALDFWRKLDISSYLLKELEGAKAYLGLFRAYILIRYVYPGLELIADLIGLAWKVIKPWLKLGITLGVTLANSIFNGYALTVLWSWFVIPVFHLPALRIPYAIGIALFVRMIVWTEHSPELNPPKAEANGKSLFVRAIESSAEGALYTLGWLITGWIITWFI